MIFTAQNIDKAFFCHCGVFRAGDTSYHILYKYPEKVLLQQQIILRQRRVGMTFQLLDRFHSLSAWFLLWTLKEMT